jgi:hypothetical protein
VSEHTFVRTHGTPHDGFQRAIRDSHLYIAELALLDMERVSLTDALALGRLYARDRSPKFQWPSSMERAGLEPATPSLQDSDQVSSMRVDMDRRVDPMRLPARALVTAARRGSG